MTMLITGGLGLIGSAIAEAALAAGRNVTIVDDGRANVVPYVEGARNIDAPIEGYGLTDPLDVVIHAAAPVGPVGILGRRVLDEMIRSTDVALEVAARNGARLVVFSSSEVYGTERPSGSLVVPDAWSHRTEYAVGKIVTEQMAHRHHAETGLPTAIVRPWNVTGPRQAGAKGFVFPRMAAQAVAGQTLTVYRPGTQRRAFMDVGDLAEGVMDLLDVPSDDPRWRGLPIDAAAPANAVSMDALARLFAAHPLSPGCTIEVVDPCVEHGPDFREAAAGSKLPPTEPAMKGTTDLRAMVDAAMRAAVPARLAA